MLTLIPDGSQKVKTFEKVRSKEHTAWKDLYIATKYRKTCQESPFYYFMLIFYFCIVPHIEPCQQNVHRWKAKTPTILFSLIGSMHQNDCHFKAIARIINSDISISSLTLCTGCLKKLFDVWLILKNNDKMNGLMER